MLEQEQGCIFGVHNMHFHWGMADKHTVLKYQKI